MACVLVVDDEPKLGKYVTQALELDGHAVVRAGGGREALALLAERSCDVVVTDLRMPDVDGLAVLQAARALPSPPEVIVMTAFGTAESAVAAMKAGAADYVTKPFALDELRLRVRRLAEQRGAAARGDRLLRQLTPDLVAESAAMKAVLAAARQVAPTDATVLLLGESGTGKSQLARYVHFQSRRASGPFVEVHCAALPETLLEGELFGHEKGAFTGAVQRKAGHLAAADGGTLFLDEIGELPAATQVKLLRFLQERTFVPLGATEPRTVDVRVVAATNRDLAAAVAEGAFREDFYYRLDVFAIRVPPLRDRPEDVLPLAERFLAARGLPADKLEPAARQRLAAHRWPGNVRELENALQRALILAGEGGIGPAHVAPSGPAGRSRGAAELLGEGFQLDAFERDLLLAALERAGGNKTHAAQLLGITRRRLYSMLASLGERPPE
ncbi:sigma-54-dependent transcriptional regulator [Anaeromyxobacter diazotrophicus]|uniref:Acetoacetate metabolism regulatory protein AtoC n=1 Tax=Anaeromyxobacter diazotrophicus TaxID=2590199 RepID=A0A7I9VRX9_9BACT|nr:sigma-54 dependent transcriptional regulator [Anaeromyxobacter diazotrophicus]GEJ59121.1 acetoacetate metabolism regulatory protein AtoC [Anaeromyxobacter diazotrophicus]